MKNSTNDIGPYPHDRFPTQRLGDLLREFANRANERQAMPPLSLLCDAATEIDRLSEENMLAAVQLNSWRDYAIELEDQLGRCHVGNPMALNEIKSKDGDGFADVAQRHAA